MVKNKILLIKILKTIVRYKIDLISNDLKITHQHFYFYFNQSEKKKNIKIETKHRGKLYNRDKTFKTK